MAREIPGFYYDEEKGKYFRIQQSHRVVPGTGYTSQSIKAAQQIKKEIEHSNERKKRQYAGKIKRSQLNLSTSPLFSRLGSNVRRNEEILRQFGSSLAKCSMGSCGIDESFVGSSFSITRSGILRASYQSLRSEVPQEYSSIQLSNHRSLAPRVAEIITSTYNDSGQEHVVISSDGSPHFDIKPVDAQGQIKDVYMHMNMGVMGVETIWDIAAAPTRRKISIATDFGLMIANCSETGSTSTVRCRDLARKEQMNVTFKDANIIMSGERSGRINFTDVRLNESVVRLQHASAVLGTLALHDANHVLAHGYSTTSTYDLRWVQEVPVNVRSRSTNPANNSQAYMQYAVPQNRWSDHYTRGRKVAYSLDLDLVAAASCNTTLHSRSSYVTLYSARTGRVVESPLTRYQYHDDVTCIDIRRVRDGPESVFCLSGSNLDEWTSGPLSYDEAHAYGITLGTSIPIFGGLNSLALSFEQKWENSNK